MKSVAGVNASGGKNRSLTVDPTGSVEGYSAVLYNNTNGLPTSEANAIAETSEGFIWIGSYGGLIRYDGNSFVRLGSNTGVASVVFLYTDSKDRLWIGTNDSGVSMKPRVSNHLMSIRLQKTGKGTCISRPTKVSWS